MTDKTATNRPNKCNSGNIVSSGSEASDTKESTSVQPKKMATRPSRFSRRSSVSSHVKHFVEHNYHDHVQDPVEADMLTFDVTEDKLKKRRGHRGGVAVPFPEKLQYMLSQMEPEDTADIVTWQPHGRCFIVHKPKEFVDEIMPRFFRQTKLTSFQRQLNLYGFSRLTAGPDRGGYYHELFLRGRMDLCKHMVRTRVKGNGSKAASSPTTEPNLYTMPPCRESAQRNLSEENEQCGDFTIIENTDAMGEDEEDDGIIGLPMDIELPDEIPPEITIRAVSSTPPPSPRDRSESFDSTPPPITSSSSCLPMVSPLETRTLVSALNQRAISSLSIPSELKLEEIHSGDQIFFEGLPFHYLETKDVEDSLLVEQRVPIV